MNKFTEMLSELVFFLIETDGDNNPFKPDSQSIQLH